MMLHVVLAYHCTDSFAQVEHHVIYELHLRNGSVAIFATLKFRLIQCFVALPAYRQFLLKQHLRFNSNSLVCTRCVADKSL